MALSYLPPEVAGLIFDKLELVRDKLAFLAVCSSWRSSVVRGVQTLVLSSSEKASPAAVTSLVAAFHHKQQRAAPGASPLRDVPTGSSTLTHIALHTGSFTHISRDLLRTISRHINLRSLAIGAEARVLVAPQDAPTADDYERLFADCVRLQDVRFAGSLAWCHGALPVSVPAVNRGWSYYSLSPFGAPMRRVWRQMARCRPSRTELQDVEVSLGKPNLPRILGGLQSLTYLHVGPNVFRSHSLTIVAQLPSLTSLTIPLDLGLPPSAFCSLTGLRSLELQLDGRDIVCRRFSFPSSFSLLTRLKRLGLYGDLDAIRLDFQHAPGNLETLRLDGWVGDHPWLTNLTHLTALTELDVRQSPGLVIPRDELLSLCIGVLDVDFFSLQLKGGGGGGEEGEEEGEDEAAHVGAVLPPSLLRLRISRLPLDKCPMLAFHLRYYLQSLEVLHLTDVRSPVDVVPGDFTLPPLPKLVELHISCNFALVDQRDRIGLEDRFPSLRQLEFIECGCYESFDVHSEENASIISEALAHPCLTQLTLADFHFSTLPPLCSCPNACEIHLFDWEKQQQQQQKQQQKLKQQATECIMPGCSNLEQLSLHGFKTTTVTFCVPLPHLQSLRLVGCQNLCSVQPKGKALAAMLPRLGRIDVRDCSSWEGSSH